MLSVKVSPKFQVVIPKEIRESLHLLPGQRMQVVQYENRIEFIPERDVAELKGFLKGIDTSFTREKDRI
jgi:AbrB family looped-hinge helix DNA binding protein